ncbi:MAG: methanol dehydrogenase [cytochrome c] subunit [Gammaproteobacteria bacterium]
MIDVKRLRFIPAAIAFAVGAVTMMPAAQAYDGTNCEAPGNCWEPKPGYPAKIEGSKYDPQHDPAEVNKQAESIAAMEERNAARVAAFKETGKFEYNVKKLSR